MMPNLRRGADTARIASPGSASAPPAALSYPRRDQIATTAVFARRGPRRTNSNTLRGMARSFVHGDPDGLARTIAAASVGIRLLFQ